MQIEPLSRLIMKALLEKNIFKGINNFCVYIKSHHSFHGKDYLPKVSTPSQVSFNNDGFKCYI